MTENLLENPLTGAGLEDLTITGTPNLKATAQARGTGTITIYQADGEQTRVYKAVIDSEDWQTSETGDAVIAGRNLLKNSRNIELRSNNISLYPISKQSGATDGEKIYDRYRRTNETLNPTQLRTYNNIPTSLFSESLADKTVSLSFRARTSHKTAGIRFLTMTDPDINLPGHQGSLGGLETHWKTFSDIVDFPSELTGRTLRYCPNATTIPTGTFDSFYMDICEWKIELGEVATVWTPAHDDIAGNVRIEIVGDVEVNELRLFIPRTTDAFQEAITSSRRELAIKARIQTEFATYELTASDLSSGSMTVTSAAMQGDFELGRAIASNLTITLLNLDGRWDDVILDGATIWPYAGIRLDDDSIEYVPMGTFIIDKPGRPYGVLGLEASDRMILLDKPFSSLGMSFPASHIQILQAISAACNVPLATSLLSQLNINRIAPKAPEGDVSCRDIVSEIALMAAGFARMTREGSLEVVPIQQPEADIAYEMPPGSRFDFKQTSDPITISGLIFGDKLWGSTDYALEVGDMELLSADDDSVLTPVYERIAGLNYTAYTATYPGNPALDPGDVVLHTTRDNRQILTIITKHTYKHGGKCTMQADGKSKAAADYRSANERRLSKVAARIEQETDIKLTAYQQASAQLADLISMSMGLYRSEDILPDGSTIFYMHDKVERSQSTIIWRLSANALTVSSDGGITWDGFTNDGNLIMKMISTIGLNAEWINTGRMTTERIDFSGQSLTDKIIELDDADHTLNQQLMDAKAGGSNLVLNSDFGTVQSPSAEWWTEQDATTCALVLARFDTCDKLKNSGLTCAQLLTYNW